LTGAVPTLLQRRGARRLGRGLAAPLSLAAALHSTPAAGLDKQGSAHGGQVAGPDSGVALSGSAALGVAPYNPTYAARPNNTGLALMRYALHADVDLIGHRLSIPLDLNLFTDRDRPGALKLAPTELDVIGGLTSTWRVGPGALELGFRAETDRPLDGGPPAPGSSSQTYVDARARYLFSLQEVAHGTRHALHGGDVVGWGTLGVFAINPTYAARPDNSGLALLRYGLHGEISVWDGHAAAAVDATLFTDRRTNAVRPTEIDLTPEIIARWAPFELHLAYEVDSPLDDLGTRPGYSQSFVYALALWAFALDPGNAPPPPVAAPQH
jgi:hypothetical protein